MSMTNRLQISPLDLAAPAAAGIRIKLLDIRTREDGCSSDEGAVRFAGNDAGDSRQMPRQTRLVILRSTGGARASLDARRAYFQGHGFFTTSGALRVH